MIHVTGSSILLPTVQNNINSYLSSHFELDQSAHRAVSVYSLDQSGITVQCLKHTHRPYGTGGDSTGD